MQDVARGIHIPDASEAAQSAVSLKTLHRVSAWRGFADVMLDWAVIAAAMGGVIHFKFHPLAVLLAMIAVARTQHSLMLEGHEGIHYALAKSRKLNDFLGSYCSFAAVGIGLRRARSTHWDHHRQFASERDEELEAFVLEDTRMSTFIMHFVRPFFFGAVISRILPGRAGKVKTAVVQTLPAGEARKDLISIALTQLVLIAAMTAIDWRLYPLLWALPLITFGALFHRIKAFCDHAGLPGEELAVLNSFSPALWDYALVGMQQKLHGEHHHFPQVPYYNLKKLRRANLIAKGEKAILNRGGYLGYLFAYYGALRTRSMNSGNSL